MNTIYIVFISIIVISFILGLFVTFFKNQNNIRLHKYNNKALKDDNYEYAKDYIYDTGEFNFSDKINIPSSSKTSNHNINHNTIIIPTIKENEEEIEELLFEDNTSKKILDPMMYAIVDDEII